MTGEQKQAIDDLRRSGLGYRKIAGRLGMSGNTVKAYIRRNGVAPAPAAEPEQLTGFCPQCGADLSLTKGRKGRKFCTEACRRAWWKAHDNIIDRRAWYSCVCAGCGRAFQSYGNDRRKFCGHGCYIKSRFYKEVLVV